MGGCGRAQVARLGWCVAYENAESGGAHSSLITKPRRVQLFQKVMWSH